MTAPIVLFVYNRPSHTTNMLESLQACRLSSQSSLIVYADGPGQNASEGELKKIADVRNIVKSKPWCRDVQLIERSYNSGLADSIVNGVGEMVSQHEKIIVLEDDLILAPGFLEYMNEALNIYRDEEKVMHISGYMYPVKGRLPDTFFLNTTSCWGWGTWQRAWKHFNPSAEILLEQLQLSGRLNEYSFNNAAPFYEHLQWNVNGKIKTWAIKWNTSVFLKKGLCLHPHPSLVRNTGNDGTGTHGSIPVFNRQAIADHVDVKTIPLYESEEARKATEQFYRSISEKKSLLKRIISRYFT